MNMWELLGARTNTRTPGELNLRDRRGNQAPPLPTLASWWLAGGRGRETKGVGLSGNEYEHTDFSTI